MSKKRENEQEESLFYASGFTNYYGAVNSVDLDEQGIQGLSEKMRARLKWHYMNAYEKYRAGGRKPWKLLIQIIKIVLVTVQVSTWNRLRFSLSYHCNHVITGIKYFVSVVCRVWRIIIIFLFLSYTVLFFVPDSLA